MATDIFTLNTALAATIEESMVKTLNDLRSVWDPRAAYETYAFVRQPQTFPMLSSAKSTTARTSCSVSN